MRMLQPEQKPQSHHQAALSRAQPPDLSASTSAQRQLTTRYSSQPIGQLYAPLRLPSRSRGCFLRPTRRKVVAVALLICALRATSAARGLDYTVVGNSMLPTLHPGDKLAAPLFNPPPSRGDLVIFSQSPCASLKNILNLPGCLPFVKRLVGLPGDLVQIGDFTISVNGRSLPPPAGIIVGRAGSWVVPEGHYFMIGDNSLVSCDSREDTVGFIPTSAVRRVTHATHADGTEIDLRNPWRNIQIPDPMPKVPSNAPQASRDR